MLISPAVYSKECEYEDGQMRYRDMVRQPSLGAYRRPSLEQTWLIEQDDTTQVI